ncbi:MAG: DUF433 domain-containing protein [Pirellulales bacterium]|nr:DUF433 domain-containing protein [Pirellulales bacterium]
MLDRIEIDPRRCGGTPVIRGTRIPVAVILDQLAMHESWESILQGYPELKEDDIRAALLYAKMSIENSEIVPVQAG